MLRSREVHSCYIDSFAYRHLVGLLGLFTLFVHGSEGADCSSVANCRTCPTHGVCTSCYPSYGVTAAGKCALCSINNSGCARCTNMTLCSRCQNVGLGPNLAANDGTCSPCSSNCKICTVSGGGKCDMCKTQYYMTPSNTCERCSIYSCAVCPNNVCTACIPGHFLMNETGTLQCYGCPSMGCTFCPTGTQGQCSACESGKWLMQWPNNTTSCEYCPIVGCTRCPGGNMCTSCQTGYYLSGPAGNTTCLPCGPYCQSCYNNPGKCDPGQCTENRLGYSVVTYNRNTSNCERCSQHCESCDISGPYKCDPGRCRAGYHLSKVNKDCTCFVPMDIVFIIPTNGEEFGNFTETVSSILAGTLVGDAGQESQGFQYALIKHSGDKAEIAFNFGDLSTAAQFVSALKTTPRTIANPSGLGYYALTQKAFEHINARRSVARVVVDFFNKYHYGGGEALQLVLTGAYVIAASVACPDSYCPNQRGTLLTLSSSPARAVVTESYDIHNWQDYTTAFCSISA